MLALHKVRQGFVKARTAQANQIRGLLGEFDDHSRKGSGLLLRSGPRTVRRRLQRIAWCVSYSFSYNAWLIISKELDRQVDELERQIQVWHRNSELSCKVAQIPG